MILPIKRRARRGGNVLSRLFLVGFGAVPADRSTSAGKGKMINHQNLGVLGVLGV